MKTIHCRYLPLLLLMPILVLATASARTWTSADGKNTFEGELVGYDAGSGKVTVNRGGKTLAFSQDLLSAADIEFLKSEGSKLPPPPTKPAGASMASKVSGSVPEKLPDPDGKEADMSKPVKVFILMGQSNMVGFGAVDGKEGSLTEAVKNKGLYPYLADDSGNWTERKDVRNVFTMQGKGILRNEWLTVPSAEGNRVGLELPIGHILGELYSEPVLILKACIGNRSLGWDLLPPSVKAYEYEGKLQPGYGETPATAGKGPTKPAGEWYAGKQYDDDVSLAKAVLEDLETYYPGAKGYEVAGFFWWQGDKDMRNPAHFNNYEKHLVELVKCLRKDFNAPNAPFVAGSLGQTKEGDKSGHGMILEAIKAVSKSKDPELNGTVGYVYTHPLSKGGSSSGHYNGNAETYVNVGEAFGRKMVEILTGR